MKETNRLIALGAGLAVVAACANFGTAQESEGSNPAIILDAGEGAAIEFPLHPATRLAAADQTESGLSLFEITIPAESAGAPPHAHTHEDEFFYVRSGTVTFMADEIKKTIGAGGFVLLPRGGWHMMWNASDTEAVLLVGTSEGRFDDFFDAVAIAAAEAENLSPPELGALVGRIGAERGIAIDMSKVPEDARPLYGLPPLD
jgi:quercetin dioxygenase-like cupin family protein